MEGAVQDEFALVGQRLDGRYDVERVVAAGGFGVVYFGHHRALRSAVAVKVLRMPPKLTEAEQQDFAQRFLAEAQTLAQLQHPAVVRALDFGVCAMPNGVTAPWAALEWVDGETLKDFLDRRRGAPMAPHEALAMLRPVLEALAVAHGLGIAHRDIKPANIMLPRGAGALPSRVLDFGIAKSMGREESATTSGATRTASGLAAFSVKYAAPEQLGGLRTGPWTDVHALALVLTEMLTGREVYPGNDFMDIAAIALRPQRPTPASLGVDVGPWEPVLARAMAYKPPERFQNAAELLAALAEALPAASAGRPRAATLPAVGGPAVSAAPVLQTMAVGAAPVQDSLSAFSRTTVDPPRPARGRRVALVAVAGLVLVGGGAAAVALTHEPPPAPQVNAHVSASPAPPVPRAVTPPAPAPPRPSAPPAPPQPAAQPAVAPAPRPVAAPAAAGRVDRARVEAVMQRQSSAIRSCYERALRDAPALAGRLDVSFTIGEGGRVTAVSTAGLSEAPAVGACVAARVRRARFPSPEGGSVEFSFPFNLTPGRERSRRGRGGGEAPAGPVGGAANPVVVSPGGEVGTGGVAF